ncbi:MAG: hypothetical protein LLG00_10460 [Planctomycetaceae bacterium]|nr:hypothetical protein [Planctomycetaceae bacterium]
MIGIDSIGSGSALAGWQLTCMIIRSAGAIGQVSFGTFGYPPSYVLAGACDPFDSYDAGTGNPLGTPGVIATSNLISDFVSVGTVAINVPSTGTNLVSIELTASGDAAGRFDIAVLPDADPNYPEYVGSGWFNHEGEEKEFVGMAFGTGPVIVGSVLVIPEPPTLALLVSGCVAVAWALRHLRKPAKRCDSRLRGH